MPNHYNYKITIRFSGENLVLENKSELQVLYSKYTTQKDTLNFRDKCVVRINAQRNFYLPDKTSAIYGNGNSIHIQIMKAILLYCLTCDKCVKVKSISMYRKKPNTKKHYYKEIKTFKQPFPDRTHLIKSLPIDVVIRRMGHVQKDYSYRIAMSYFLREQYSLHPYHKFECLWRAYNCLFRNLTGTGSDNAGIRGMISHVLLHTDKYNQTCSCANAVDLNDKMFKFKSFLIDKIEHLKRSTSIMNWMSNFTKSEILNLIRQNEVVIGSKIDSIAANDAATIKSNVHTYLTTTREDASKVNVEKFIFLLWYAYFLRNMYFHAVIKEASFTLYSEYNDKHLMCVTEIMETFLREIFEDDTF